MEKIDFDGFHRFFEKLLSEPLAHKTDKKSCHEVQKWLRENAYPHNKNQFKSIFFQTKSYKQQWSRLARPFNTRVH